MERRIEKEGRRKRRRLLSTESDSSHRDVPCSENRKNIHHEANMEPEWSHNSGYDSDGNSSVESLNYIMYPSASVLSKINSKSNSEKAESKDFNKEKIKDTPQKSLTGRSKKSKISTKQPEKKETFNKTVKKISSKIEHERDDRRKILNNAEKNKTSVSITKENKNPNLFQREKNEPVCKKPRLYQSVSNKDEGSLLNRYEKSDTATCSYFQKNQTKKSTVKKRPENFGSRLNPLLNDFKSHANNKSQSNEKTRRITKPKDQWQIKYKEMEKKSKINDQNSKSQSAKNDSGIESLPEVGDEDQSSTELLYSEELKNDDEIGRSSKFYNLPQIPKEDITSNLENSNSNREFNETVSQPCNSSESLSNYPNESNGINRNVPSNCSLNLIRMIVDLDLKWLEEKESHLIRKPPPNIEIKEGMKLPTYFESFDDYHHKYLSLLTLEVWEKICLKANSSHTNKKKFTFSVDSYDYDFGQTRLMRLECKSAVSAPEENSLVIVNLKLSDGQIKSTFGFIEQFECKNKDLNETNGSHHKAPVKQLVFNMFVKSRMTPPETGCQIEGKFVCSLYKETKQAEALYLMKFSPLLKYFLKPSWNTFCTSYKQYNGEFFEVQKNISDVVSQEINISQSRPKIMLLQGPPGSGKTKAIVSIASNLLRNKENPKKILIVAPSHFALDEICNQLCKLNELFANPIKFVRLGQIGTIHHNFSKYSLHKFLEECRMSYKHNYSSLNSNLKTMKNKEILNDQLKEKILSDTSLILALPEDCWELHKLKVRFSCCLIDEVNQSTELDILYPFALGISKFLLVADHMQLPANVESEMARNCGYQRSLMERFQSYFKIVNCKNPTIVLSQQFRFNSRIADFPFKHFYSYSDYREKCLYADKRIGFHPFRPYAVLDDRRHYGTKDKNHIQETGVNAVISLCSYISDKLPESSIGIIVPTAEMQQNYNDAIVSIFKSDNVEVETVDHFQGREKTVIILSCYHDFRKVVPFETNYFEDVRKLNVALTRAISSLIICGPLHESMKYNIWSDIVTDSKNRRCYFEFEYLNECQLSRILNNLKT